MWEPCVFKEDPLSHFYGLEIGIFGFPQKETGAKSVTMATTKKVSFSSFCDAHFWY